MGKNKKIWFYIINNKNGWKENYWEDFIILKRKEFYKFIIYNFVVILEIY